MTHPLTFEQSLAASLRRVENKARQVANAFKAESCPTYWPAQCAKAADPMARSWDALAEWIAV